MLFPEHFGVVDQFVVKALLQVEGLPERTAVAGMNPEGLKVQDGVTLIQILRDKAARLNAEFGIDEWTPRKIDKVLWCIGR